MSKQLIRMLKITAHQEDSSEVLATEITIKKLKTISPVYCYNFKKLADRLIIVNKMIAITVNE